jgi:hypothetical protein
MPDRLGNDLSLVLRRGNVGDEFASASAGRIFGCAMARKSSFGCDPTPALAKMMLVSWPGIMATTKPCYRGRTAYGLRRGESEIGEIDPKLPVLKWVAPTSGIGERG